MIFLTSKKGVESLSAILETNLTASFCKNFTSSFANLSSSKQPDVSTAIDVYIRRESILQFRLVGQRKVVYNRLTTESAGFVW